MALFAIADLHLSSSVSKPMDIFGGAWVGYVEKIRRSLENLRPEDTLVIAGDLSWGISLAEARGDFLFLSSFPGRKLLVKGNHDLWWETAAKMNRFFVENDINDIEFIHNNCKFYDNIALCGTRGWFYEEERGGEHDAKMLNRELSRLKTSLDAAKSAHASRIYCFIHYPPIFGSYECAPIARMLETYGVEQCFYGHLHGESCKLAFQGVKNGVKYSLLSGDYVNFVPISI